MKKQKPPVKAKTAKTNLSLKVGRGAASGRFTTQSREATDSKFLTAAKASKKKFAPLFKRLAKT